MAEEPLIFVEVALVEGLADNVQELLDAGDNEGDGSGNGGGSGGNGGAGKAVDTAIFYSISNAQRGLSGISFGGFLNKRVLDDVTRELPGIKTAATLSPIPGFRSWLERRLVVDGDSLFTAVEMRGLEPLLSSGDRSDDNAAVIAELLDSAWHRDETAVEALR
jgi:malonyl-CoA decarboxylase